MKRALAWKTRPRQEQTIAARRSIWESRDGRFRVVRSQSLFGLPTVFYSCCRGVAGEWAILGRHRKRGPALARCRRYWLANTRQKTCNRAAKA